MPKCQTCKHRFVSDRYKKCCLNDCINGRGGIHHERLKCIKCKQRWWPRNQTCDWKNQNCRNISKFSETMEHS